MLHTNTICFLLFWSFAFSIISCQEKPKKDETEQNIKNENPLYMEVMAIHDAVMPEMGTIHAYKKELKILKNSFAGENKILDAIQQLNKADDGMMDWMAAFKVPENKDSTDLYLQNEKIKIQKVSDDMYASMAAAKKLIDSLKQIQ
ncbi:MAG: hypothetical protein IPN79_03545 [Saprospiraceae bacterium]|nr:hypothetical protein [Saprospiraceae bacterium]